MAYDLRAHAEGNPLPFEPHAWMHNINGWHAGDHETGIDYIPVDVLTFTIAGKPVTAREARRYSSTWVHWRDA